MTASQDKRRENHYVPEWYQKGFLIDGNNQLHRLDLAPNKKELPDGRIISLNDYHTKPTSKCFVQRDLYTTFFGKYVDDEIECRLFGEIDDKGARAVRAYTTTDMSAWHKHFNAFFEYIDAQKIRTPKGLSWIKQHYSGLNQNTLMREMQSIQRMNCTVWTEGVREVVSAKNSDIKFIISDHPVTTYNHALPPEASECLFPNDPNILLKATQTIFPLDMDHCLILTNLEFAQSPDNCDPLMKRTCAKNFRSTMARTDQVITGRNLNSSEILSINHILKSRAHKYIAAGEKSWLYPEKEIRGDWASHRNVLLPPKNNLFSIGAETYIGYKDGSTGYQDAFGRTTPENKHLRKPKLAHKIKPKDDCGCGSGRQYRHCCKSKKENQRPSWNYLSIRERNLALCRCVKDVLGFNEGKDWNDVRKELSAEHVKEIHEFYSVIWPQDTVLVDLLPKPDKTLRALYSGIIDPRVISKNVVSLSLYFDEIIIQSPFLNPNSVNPDFSPIEKPEQYLRETLKNVLLLLELEPFIDSGLINLIPDLCNFDIHLQRQMLNMAEQRTKLLPIEAQDVELATKLQENELKRILLQTPKEILREQYKEASPELDEERIEELLRYNEKLVSRDPLALLGKENSKTPSSHMLMFNMSPNFEIALFLSQVTGSILLTDNRYRWKEILNTKVESFFQSPSEWTELLREVSKINLPVHSHIFKTFDLRLQGKSERMRLALKNLCRVIKSPAPTQNKENAVQKILNQLQSAEIVASKDIQTTSLNPDFDKLIDASMQSQCSFTFFAPQGGIQHHNTQRMLISYGGIEHLNNVPIAIYVNHEWTYEELDVF